MEKKILHIDMNSCYASIELMHHPELRGHPVAVGGDPEARHGIVLAKNQEAKKYGIKTGEALWQARQKCPHLIFVPPHMDLYMRYSEMAHAIYRQYSDQQEPFGLDECWVDVTGTTVLGGDPIAIAEEIRQRMKDELGITVSIGVSWNKIFAKFGSDYKKPDAVTVITEENYKDIVWKSPVEDLLYVGPATERKLKNMGIYTVGDLANSDPEFLKGLLGKMGLVLYLFANGKDKTPVNVEGTQSTVKTIGNSCTTPRDLVCYEDVKIITYVLAESVSARLREAGLCCRTVEVSIRDNNLYSFTRQHKLEEATDLTAEIAEAALKLFRMNYRGTSPIRSMGVRAMDLVDASSPIQLSMFVDEQRRERLHHADLAVDEIRRRFGHKYIQRGVTTQDLRLAAIDAKEDHTVHPHSYFEHGNRTGVETFKF